MHGRLKNSALLIVLICALPLATQADERTQKNAELQNIHGRIESLRKDIAKNEANRADVVDSLRETEQAISASNKRLRELADSRNELKRQLADIQAQSNQITGQIGSQQKQIGTLLYRQYLSGRGNDDALKLLLSGEDPNQIARDYHYLTLLSHAKTTMVDKLHDTLAEKQRLASATQDRTDKLADNQKQQQQAQQTLLAQQKQRQTVLDGISDKIKHQQRDLDTLKQNEKRLTSLIAGLSKRSPKPARPTEKSKSASSSSSSSPGIKNDREPDANLSGAFASLRGKLRLPVRGEVVNRFGAPRVEGTTWRGLFIRASEGTDVKSVAAGQVVFADWLRGFGNLIIIDHGDGWLTVYGNNQALLRKEGDRVKAGDVVASVGNSGGNPESGLYFELRHQGQALDPMQWVSLR
ncbi:MAG TPA: peptidoglycan DD-metalloendopeptidase family protein [Rhodocyclaceae bacterium]|nr:peptidoglycan DD-metalloendopeptidase family protein [Rhodocyclaceae bacterium]